MNRDEFFGDPRCPQSGVWVCDDFESENAGDAADASVWRRVGMMPVISADRAARGTKSLKLHTSNSSSSAIEVTKIFPAPNNTVWGRMFIWIDDMPTAPMWAHWNIVAANGEGDGSEIRVGGQWDGQRNRFGTGTDHGATGDWTDLDMDPSAAEAAVREDEWLCVEWLYKGDTNEIRFFLDAKEHPSLHQSEDDHGGQSGGTPFVFPEFDRLAVGFWMYHGNTTPLAYDVWIDEVVLDAERIGCVF